MEGKNRGKTAYPGGLCKQGSGAILATSEDGESYIRFTTCEKNKYSRKEKYMIASETRAVEVVHVPEFVIKFLCTCDILLRQTLQAGVEWYLEVKLQQAFKPQRLAEILNLLRDALFFEDDPPSPDTGYQTFLEAENNELEPSENIHHLQYLDLPLANRGLCARKGHAISLLLTVLVYLEIYENQCTSSSVLFIVVQSCKDLPFIPLVSLTCGVGVIDMWSILSSLI
ncbi:sorting nexin-14 [Trichonephila inaurata madagascariensis]|uniref:Sorting nexin-14 n=1 Tax=Trichonephila inaurata madagascariensis TaxID=2747483 RepID=A0A8X6X2I9_9ARAC|nr:sorting nexin-14 [Trichonephila inaurata madagascariensis]